MTDCNIAGYWTHYAILAACVARTTGPLLECGVGEGSTVALHYMARSMGRPLLSADTDPAWLKKFQDAYGHRDFHKFDLVGNWTNWKPATEMEWGVALVDLAPGMKRTPFIRRIKDNARFIVAHDSERDYGTGANYRYEDVIPEFKHVSEFRRWRPYTLVLSNYEPFEIEIADTTWKPGDPA